MTLVLHFHPDPNALLSNLTLPPFPSLPHLQRLQWRRLNRGPGLGWHQPPGKDASCFWDGQVKGPPGCGVTIGSHRLDACWDPQPGPQGLRSQRRLVVGFPSLGCWLSASTEPRCSPGKGSRAHILLPPVSVQIFLHFLGGRKTTHKARLPGQAPGTAQMGRIRMAQHKVTRRRVGRITSLQPWHARDPVA